jgi:LuxR family maltose regulon positive regulatory protein
LRDLHVLKRSVGGNHLIAISKTQFLATKLLPPQSAPRLITRLRLLDLIEQVQARQVTVIMAGPGLGKASLPVVWAERLQKCGKSIAWLTLDADDDEPTRCLCHIAKLSTQQI